jgi:hypothetical protein
MRINGQTFIRTNKKALSFESAFSLPEQADSNRYKELRLKQ